jgi:hypothetical protein
MDFATLETLRLKHPAWRLLIAAHAPLIVGFLHRAFVEANARAQPQRELVLRLEDHLQVVRERRGDESFPRTASAYLDEWAADGTGWLRKFYPPGMDGESPHPAAAARHRAACARGARPAAVRARLHGAGRAGTRAGAPPGAAAVLATGAALDGGGGGGGGDGRSLRRRPLRAGLHRQGAAAGERPPLAGPGAAGLARGARAAAPASARPRGAGRLPQPGGGGPARGH